MTTSPKTTEHDLSRLARLMGIEASHGWKSRLAERLGVDLAILSHWLKRGMPRRQIGKVVKMGYPSDRWIVAKSPPGSLVAEPLPEYRISKDLRLAPTKRPTHEDLIGQFQNKALALELNEMLLQIEAADPELLKGYVKGFLQGILTMIEHKKNGTDP